MGCQHRLQRELLGWQRSRLSHREAVPQLVTHLCLFHTMGKFRSWVFFVTVPSVTFDKFKGGHSLRGLAACSDPLQGGRAWGKPGQAPRGVYGTGAVELRTEKS